MKLSVNDALKRHFFLPTEGSLTICWISSDFDPVPPTHNNCQVPYPQLVTTTDSILDYVTPPIMSPFPVYEMAVDLWSNTIAME